MPISMCEICCWDVWKRFSRKYRVRILFSNCFFRIRYENLSVEPYPRFGKRIWYETFFGFIWKRFNTEPLVRNLCFIFSYMVWYETSFFRNQKRIVSCIEVKNLFRFGKRLFLFECMILNAVKRTFVKSTFKDLLSNQPMLYFLRPDTNDYVNKR